MKWLIIGMFFIVIGQRMNIMYFHEGIGQFDFLKDWIPVWENSTHQYLASLGDLIQGIGFLFSLYWSYWLLFQRHARPKAVSQT